MRFLRVLLGGLVQWEDRGFLKEDVMDQDSHLSHSLNSPYCLNADMLLVAYPFLHSKSVALEHNHKNSLDTSSFQLSIQPDVVNS